MGRPGLFQQLLDDQMSPGEREAVNAAHDRADAAVIANGTPTAAMALLHRRIAEQRKELEKMRVLVGVLAAVLRDHKIIDPHILDYRLEAAMDDLEDATGETKPAPQLTSCASCGAHVPVTNTAVTAAGTVCDACFQRG